jgi:hypothetical protein
MEGRKIMPIPELELQPLGRSGRKQLLNRLHYPGSSPAYAAQNFKDQF